MSSLRGMIFGSVENSLTLVSDLSLLSIPISLFAFFIAVRGDLRQARQESARRTREQREQAASVASWVRPGDSGENVYTMEVRNDSQLPIRHVATRLLDDEDKIIDLDYHFVVPPSLTISKDIPRPVDAPWQGDHLRAAVAFTDTLGTRWERTGGGALKELPREFTLYSGVDVRQGLEKYKRRFAEEFSIEVTINSTLSGAKLRNFFLDSSGYMDTNCDAVVGPHDWIGELSRSKCLKHVAVPMARSGDPLVREAFEVFDVGFSSFGVPLAYDTAILHVNRDLYKGSLPNSIKEMFELGRALTHRPGSPEVALSMGERRGSTWTGDPFMAWPVLVGLGGTVFDPHGNGAWAARIATGDARERLVLALKSLQGLAKEYPSSFRGMTHGQARRAFVDGRTAFLIDVGGALAEMKSDMNVELAQLPNFSGLKRPFLSLIYGFYFRELSALQDEKGFLRSDYARNGEDFLHYHLSSPSLCRDLSRTLGLPVISREQIFAASGQADLTQNACLDARPMPALPEMNYIWAAVGKMIVQCLRREAKIHSVVDDAARRVQRVVTAKDVADFSEC